MSEQNKPNESPRRSFLKAASLGAVAIGLSALGGKPDKEKPAPATDPSDPKTAQA